MADGERLKIVVTKKTGNDVGAVARLVTWVIAEVLNLDPTVDEGEALAAVCNAFTARNDDPSAVAEAKRAVVTRFWAVKAGTQMVTMRMSSAVLAKLKGVGKIPIGWAMTRVIKREPEPLRCYQCYGFGHQFTACKGPDLSGACHRCGEKHHSTFDCTSGFDRCITCEHAEHPHVNHKPGSSACRTRKVGTRDRRNTAPRNGSY